MARYLVVIEPGPHNYGAYVPDLPGCVATGKTVEKTLANIQGAMEMHLSAMMEDGDPIPLPVTTTIADAEPGELMTWVEVDTDVPQAVKTA
jgi:predicted RNase H-like HicB family nuclease